MLDITYEAPMFSTRDLLDAVGVAERTYQVQVQRGFMPRCARPGRGGSRQFTWSDLFYAGFLRLASEAHSEGEDATAVSTPRGSLDMVERVQAEIRAHDGAIRGCRVRRLETIGSARVAEAATLRDQAADKSRELKSIENKSGKLLAQITDLQGCEYVPGATPKSSILRAEIEQLERAALDIDQSDIPDAGVVDVDDTIDNEQILLSVQTHPSRCPSIEAVSTWLGACEAEAQKSRHSGFGDHPRRVHLVWNADGIDVRQSTVSCGALAKRQPDGVSIYPQTGEFRAGVAPISQARDAQPAIEVPAHSGWYRA